MKREARSNIASILDISIKNKKGFLIAILFSLFSAIVSLLIPLVVGTFMENLTDVGEKISPEKIFSAVLIFIVVYILQGLSSYVLFDDFSNGLDTDIGENGHKLSEGQKQRINIARAIISKPIILLLDEITSNLDSEIEHQIMRLIERQTTTTTIVIIAHRLNTIRNADLIYVMNEQGKIESYGTHQYLIENCEIYKKLVRNAVYCG